MHEPIKIYNIKKENKQNMNSTMKINNKNYPCSRPNVISLIWKTLNKNKHRDEVKISEIKIFILHFQSFHLHHDQILQL